MKYLGWGFWLLNALVSVSMIYQSSKSYNVNGVRELATPAAWIWIWQAIGVGLVLFLELSPWYLLVWFPFGIIVCAIMGRILYLAGVIRF